MSGIKMEVGGRYRLNDGTEAYCDTKGTAAFRLRAGEWAGAYDIDGRFMCREDEPNYPKHIAVRIDQPAAPPEDADPIVGWSITTCPVPRRRPHDDPPKAVVAAADALSIGMNTWQYVCPVYRSDVTSPAEKIGGEA